MMAIYRKDVEFKTIDGLTLKGWLYPTSARGPAIVITPGVNLPFSKHSHSIAK